VIVACHAGIGTSQLLLEKLKQHFRFQIVDVVSAHEASRLKEGQADLIISTVRIPECKIENVVVSAYLSDEDYLRVGNKIDAIRTSRHLSGTGEERELTAARVLEQIRPAVTSRLDKDS
jgi:galactitol-specific phosphotransferase system IIB component